MAKPSHIYFEIIEKKRSKTFYMLNAILALFFLLLLFSAHYDEGKEQPYIRTAILSGFFFAVMIIIVIRSYTKKEFSKLGQIHFLENEIKIVSSSKANSFNVDEIMNLQLDINDTSEDPASMRSFANLEGINNYVKFIDKNGEQHCYRVYIEGIKSLRLLDRFLKSWNYRKFELIGSRSITNY